jgi:hypothetical protein
MDRINSEVVGSHTLITFCGSPALGRHVESARLELQVLAEIAGVRHHTAVFQQENYGQAGAPKPPSASEKQHLRASSVSPEPSGKDQIRIASKVTTDSQSVESLDV